MTGDHIEHLVFALSGAVGGGGLLRFGVYVSNACPPLGPNASWTQKFAYNMLKGLSGVDPNAITPPKIQAIVDIAQKETDKTVVQAQKASDAVADAKSASNSAQVP